MLGDLDELVLRCRNEQARDRIGEAVRAYKAAAYRSAIIMTWVALAYDLVDKIRELSVNGDAAAVKKMEEYDKLHKFGNVPASLKFERELLESAKADFELISDSELIELARIQEDRNRCAHPSLNVDGEAFSPSAELARVHIRAAIEYVMQNEPAQGKHALSMVMDMVKGDYFPRGQQKVTKALTHSPLMTGRKSLVRGFMALSLKAILRDGVDDTERGKYLHCLAFIREKRPDMWQELFEKEVALLTRALDVKQNGISLLWLIRSFEESWAVLLPAVSDGLDLLVRDLPADDVVLLDDLLQFDPLKAAAQARVRSLVPDDMLAFYLAMSDEIWRHVIRSMCKAESYAVANSWVSVFCDVVLLGATDLTELEEHHVCEAIVNNRQLRECKKVGDLIATLEGSKHSKGEQWYRVLKAMDA